jgi:hypothetical protein
MLKQASHWAEVQHEAAELFTLAWFQSVPSRRKMVATYNKDPSKPNPFEEPDPGNLSASVCVTLAENPDRWCTE